MKRYPEMSDVELTRMLAKEYGDLSDVDKARTLLHVIYYYEN